MPTGMLTKKIHGHENTCVRRPPRIRPTAEPPIAIAAHTPSALARSLPSANVVEMIDSAAGEIRAAPRPWTAREAISIPELTDTPARNEADGEDDKANQEEPLAPEEVAGAAAEQQEPAEEEGVGVHDPLEIRLAQIEIRLDRRKRDVDDGRVEDDHELGDADEDEDDPGIR